MNARKIKTISIRLPEDAWSAIEDMRAAISGQHNCDVSASEAVLAMMRDSIAIRSGNYTHAALPGWESGGTGIMWVKIAETSSLGTVTMIVQRCEDGTWGWSADGGTIKKTGEDFTQRFTRSSPSALYAMVQCETLVLNFDEAYSR